MADHPVPVGPSASGKAVINRIKLEIRFQRYPGVDRAAGIAGLAYTVAVDGGPATKGTTAADGTVSISLAAGELALLTILDTEYEVSIRAGAVEPTAQLRGQQRRLRLLGYQLGQAGADGDGIDGHLGYKTERSLLDFQADAGLQIDAVVGPATQKELKKKAGC